MNYDNKIGTRVVRGLDFSPESVDKARSENKMLVLDMDFTTKCNLRCFYCDRSPDINEKQKEEITLSERKDVIFQANRLGAWAVGILGAGEPMLDPAFWELIEYIDSLNMVPLLYTSGWEIKSIDTVKELFDHNVSIMLKYNTEKEFLADKMVGVKGYGSHVKTVMKWLLAAGFNKSTPTRLAINVVATKNTLDEDEFLNLFIWCRENNIYMHGQSLIPSGKADNIQFTLNKTEAVSLLQKGQQIDQERYGFNYSIVPPIIGGFRCRKVNVGMFINAYGEVWDCNGSGRKLGSFPELTLEEIWNSNKAKKVREPLQEGFCHIRESWWGNIDNGWKM